MIPNDKLDFWESLERVLNNEFEKGTYKFCKHHKAGLYYG